jgi:hypothetical protein
MSKESFVPPEAYKDEREGKLEQKTQRAHTSWMETMKNMGQGALLATILVGGAYSGVAHASEALASQSASSEERTDHTTKSIGYLSAAIGTFFGASHLLRNRKSTS